MPIHLKIATQIFFKIALRADKPYLAKHISLSREAYLFFKTTRVITDSKSTLFD